MGLWIGDGVNGNSVRLNAAHQIVIVLEQFC